MKNRVMIFGPKVADGTYVVELLTANGAGACWSRSENSVAH